ncbi:MAG: helix-turn-helix transcriptional regulator, partial [Muribaculaceae bacterium]
MIGDTLKRMRIIYDYKAKDMSALLNISPSYLSEIENNKKSPSLDLLKRYADIFEVKVSSLMLLAEQMEENPQGNQGVKKMMLNFVKIMSDIKMSDENEEI